MKSAEKSEQQTMHKPDQEIDDVEKRIEAERHALSATLAQAGHSAKCSLTHPKALLVAAGVGYVLGELIRRPRKVVATRRAEPAGAAAGAAGIIGLVGTGLGLLLRVSGYSNPVALAQAALAAFRKPGRPPGVQARRAGLPSSY